jgi:hypothetical protein
MKSLFVFIDEIQATLPEDNSFSLLQKLAALKINVDNRYGENHRWKYDLKTVIGSLSSMNNRNEEVDQYGGSLKKTKTKLSLLLNKMKSEVLLNGEGDDLINADIILLKFKNRLGDTAYNELRNIIRGVETPGVIPTAIPAYLKGLDQEQLLLIIEDIIHHPLIWQRLKALEKV